MTTLPNFSTESATFERPFLWTEDVITAQCLSECFRIATPGGESQGYHIIAMQSELAIRLLARKIQAAGGTVQIFPCQERLEVSIAGMGISAAPMILMGVVPYDQWVESCADQPLELKEALAIAEEIIKIEPDSPERNIALDVLRRRAKVSEYNWDRKYLDPIRARLERALNLPDDIDPSERKRLELKAIAQERDCYRFTDKLIEFCRRTGWTRRDAEQQIRLLKTSTITPKARRLKGKDFLALETESISWIFPGIVPGRGVFVIGGHAGTGKTTFAYDAVGSLLLEEEFLGEKPVKTGKVLLVTGDELPCFTQDKLIDRGIPLDNDNWEIILNWDISQWNDLEEAIADIKPALVVIDSFSSIHRDPSFDENSSQAKSTIYDLEALSNAYEFSCILIHHLSKSKDNQGVAKLRGSSAISAAASVVCLMESMSDGARKLSFPKIRGAQTKPFTVDLEIGTGRYTVLGGGDDAGTKSLGDRILDLLTKNPFKRFEPSEISEVLGIPSSNRNSVYQALNRLFNRGLITKRPSTKGDGKCKVYGVKNPFQLSHTEELRSVADEEGDTHPPTRLNVSHKKPETIDIKELKVHDTLCDSIHDTYVTHQNDVQAVSGSNEVVEGIPTYMTDTSTQGGVSPLSGENCHTTSVDSTPNSPQHPPIGWWAYVDGKLAQVFKHYRHGVAFKGEGVYGIYRNYQLLTEVQMLQNGLSWHKVI